MVDEPEPVKATHMLAVDHHDWKALFEGYDALRSVMYRSGYSPGELRGAAAV